MRGLAFGILDPEGERYQLALAHRSECPACRAYILSLRGLAAVLPVPMFLPGVLGAGALAGAGAGVGAGAGAGVSSGAGGAGAGAGAQVGSGIGALSASGTAGAGAGAAGGGWLLAGGSVGAKLAVGCLIAFGVGASCVALNVNPDHALGGRASSHRRHPGGYGETGAARAGATDSLTPGYLLTGGVSGVVHANTAASGRSVARSAATPAQALTPAAKANREFGPERAFAETSSSSHSSSSSSSTQQAPTARAASAGDSGSQGSTAAGSREFTSTAASVSGGQSATPSSGSGRAAGSAAQHEFGIG
jgi:hypothetical protein